RALRPSRANARPDVVAIGAHEDLFPRTAWSPDDFRGVAAGAVVERCEVALQRLKELARLAQPSCRRYVLRRAAAPRVPSPLGEYCAAGRASRRLHLRPHIRDSARHAIRVPMVSCGLSTTVESKAQQLRSAVPTRRYRMAQHVPCAALSFEVRGETGRLGAS